MFFNFFFTEVSSPIVSKKDNKEDVKSAKKLEKERMKLKYGSLDAESIPTKQPKSNFFRTVRDYKINHHDKPVIFSAKVVRLTNSGNLLLGTIMINSGNFLTFIRHFFQKIILYDNFQQPVGQILITF